MASKILNKLIEKGVLVSPKLLEKDIDETTVKDVVKFFGEDLDVLDEELIYKFKNKEKQILIKKNYDNQPKKRTYKDFVRVFNIRFKKLSKMLRKRQELQGIMNIRRIKDKDNREKVSLIGMIKDKRKSKNNHVILELEDPSDIVTVIIRKTDDTMDFWDEANDLVLDEVIGVTGTWLSGAVFADNILYPDVPFNKELRKQKEEEYMICIGDTHFGSNVFMEEEWTRFMKWLNGEIGTKHQRKIAKNIKYIIFTGDLVEGAGIYPGQENDLAIEDIEKQYEIGAKWLKKVPNHIHMVATTGNHDAGRLAEPQMPPLKKYASSLYEIPNLKLVSNPAVVNVGKTKNFPGFDVMLYHGGSLIYYSDAIPSIRSSGGQKQAGEIMKRLIQKRHLAPSHGSTLYVPDSKEDHLLIEEVPDFLITGHIHRAAVKNYRNVTMINASCWTETTEDQIKRGLEPQPGRVPIVNLKTRKVGMMNFLSKQQKQKEKEKVKKATQIE